MEYQKKATSHPTYDPFNAKVGNNRTICKGCVNKGPKILITWSEGNAIAFRI